MEIDTRAAAAFGAHDRSPLQKTLTQVFKVTKSSSPLAESKSKAGNAGLQQAGVELCRLPTLVLVKPEPVECHGSLVPESTASLLCRESTTFTVIPIPVAAPSLQKVKVELLSPSLCVTNGTEGVASNSVESLATAHANLKNSMCLPPTSVSPNLDLPVASKPLQALSEKATPVMTTLVMTQDPCKHPSSTTRVKLEPAEPVTAANTGGVGGLVSSTATFTDTPAQSQQKDNETTHAAEAATSMKLKTSSYPFPDKLDPMKVDVQRAKPTPAPSVTPIADSALLHVKSEPVAAVSRPPLRKPSVVKEEVLNSPPQTRSGRFKQPAALASSESDEDSEDEEEPLLRRLRNGYSSQKGMKARKSNPGFRIQGGRVYDSEFGRTCHWCRQKTVEHHVKCRKCTIYYCGPCLLNRNGERVQEELCEGVEWLCPKCRDGCGPGCDNCCNCGPCRKALGFPPTGQLIGQARKSGFNNAHDYLIHLETGESASRIARRKRGKGWTNEGRFQCKEASETADSDADASLSSHGDDEFTLNEETSTQVHQGLLDMKFVRKIVKSQKRKRVSTRAPLPAKRNRVEVRRDVDTVGARFKTTRPSFSKKKEAAVPSACQIAMDKVKTTERRTDDNELQTRACKREYMECNDGSDLETSVKREKLTGDQRPASSNEYFSSRSSFGNLFACKEEPIGTNVDTPDAQGGSSPFTESEVFSKVFGARAVNDASSDSRPSMSEQQRGMECPTDSQGTDFRMKLKAALAQSFDAKELGALDCSVRCRKPVQKLRHMRGRVVDIVTEYEGLSYLDHHQDFAAKLEVAQSPPEKLALLRGFFFWLQHSCMEGAFRPWPSALAKSGHQSGDCIETEGPDCQVTAVVLQLDEANEANPLLERSFINPVERPFETTLLPFGSHLSKQSVLPYPAKKISSQPEKPKMRSQMQPEVTFQVVLGLPAPARG